MSIITELECSKGTAHTYIPRDYDTGLPMQKSDYDQIDMYRDGVKICLVFPSKTEEEEKMIKNDVKNILTNALKEQLQMKM